MHSNFYLVIFCYNKVMKTHIHYHKDGSIWVKGQMKGDAMEGYWEWFRKPAKGGKQKKTGEKIGTRMRSGHFKDGKQVGEWITYDTAGKVYKITQMKE